MCVIKVSPVKRRKKTTPKTPRDELDDEAEWNARVNKARKEIRQKQYTEQADMPDATATSKV